MAPATKRRKKTTPKKKSARTPLVPAARKIELLGLVLVLLAVLLSLAVVSFSPADRDLARSFSTEDLLTVGEGRAQNRVGLVGAFLARLLVPSFIGYPALLLTGLLGVWGYVVFRHRRPQHLPLLSALTGLGAFLAAALVGWFALVLDADLLAWTGAWGAGTSAWLQHAFGTAGSLIVLLFLIAVNVLLVVDRDVQRTLDRVEDAVTSVRGRTAAWWEGMRARSAERRAERERLVEARAAEREAGERERAKKPASTSNRRTAAAEPPASGRSAPGGDGRRVNDLYTDRTADRAAERTAAPPPPAPKAEPRPAPPPPPAPKPAPPQPSPAGDGTIELKVRERIEEEKADPAERAAEVVADEDLEFEFPPLDLLDEAAHGEGDIDLEELEENKRILLDKLETYKIEITDINAIVGPTVTLYELTPAPGVKISKITSLEDDLAMAMAAPGIRMIAPIPGKSAIGVEIPNRKREMVRIRDMIGTARFRDNKMELPAVLGKTIEGEAYLQDLAKMPHLLIAGATGSGKSVGVNTLITGLLYACPPSNLKFVMVDPKKIELAQYGRLIDHYIAMPPEADTPVITDFNEALGVLKSCEKEMERRYDLLSKATVRGIKDYNKRFAEGRLKADDGHRHLPYIVVIVDELADLMMTAGKDIEGPIARLAQMARAVGIHLVLATQRPSVDVITGLIKANFPARIAYQVASKVDSRTILDQNGAEGLVGNGDMLYMIGSRMERLQGPFVSVEEVDEITHFVAEQPGAGPYVLPSLEEVDDGETNRAAEVLEDTDDLFEEAARIIVRSQQGSVSLLQRKLSVGYTRAARIVDQLEEAGIVGPFEGSKARSVLLENELQLDAFLREDDEAPAPPPAAD